MSHEDNRVQDDWAKRQERSLAAFVRAAENSSHLKKVIYAHMAPYRQALWGGLLFYAVTAVFTSLSWQVCLLLSFVLATAVFIFTPPDSLGETKEDQFP